MADVAHQLPAHLSVDFPLPWVKVIIDLIEGMLFFDGLCFELIEFLVQHAGG